MDHRPLAVALLVVLAGCGAVFGGSDGATPTAETAVTPAPVPSPATTATPAADLSAYPGVGADGRPNPQLLLQSHLQALSERSFTVEWTRWRSNASAGRTLVYRRVAAVENATTYRYSVVSRNVEGRVEKYVEPGGGVGRRVYPNGTAETRRLLAPVEGADRRFGEVIAVALTNLFGPETSVSAVQRRGQRFARFVSRRAPAFVTSIQNNARIESFTATAYVHPAGYVSTIVYQYDVVTESGRAHVVHRFRYRAVGETNVTEPAWADLTNGTDGGDRPTS